MVELRSVDAENWVECTRLSLHPHQEKLLAAEKLYSKYGFRKIGSLDDNDILYEIDVSS